MLKNVPSILIEPKRAAPGFAATEYEIEPLPVPVFPFVTVIQLSLGSAFHVQEELLPAIVNVPDPPAAAIDARTGVSVHVHPLA